MSEIDNLRLELANLRDRAADLAFAVTEEEHSAETVRVAGELIGLEVAALELEAQILGLMPSRAVDQYEKSGERSASG